MLTLLRIVCCLEISSGPMLFVELILEMLSIHRGEIYNVIFNPVGDSLTSAPPRPLSEGDMRWETSLPSHFLLAQGRVRTSESLPPPLPGLIYSYIHVFSKILLFIFAAFRCDSDLLVRYPFSCLFLCFVEVCSRFTLIFPQTPSSTAREEARVGRSRTHHFRCKYNRPRYGS